MDSSSECKPTKYYIDFENVHGPGLKGVDELDERDEVYVFYSQAAETFHIEQAIDIMKSKARIEFVEIDGGTRNSLDFQLVAALFGTMTEGYDYAIVSGDGGFDAAIRMGERLELPSVRRITDLTGSTESPQPKSTRQRRTRRTSQKDKKEQGTQAEHEEAPAAQQKLPAAKTPQQLPAPEEPANASTAGSAPSAQDAEIKPAATESANQAAAEAESAEDADAEEKELGAAPAKSGRYSKRKEIKALLVNNGVTLNQQQLSSVMKALNGVKNKQGFYRSIIQEEKQERGLELYRLVRDYYETMVEILRS